MKLFAGLSHTDYQDILRAVGAFLDERSLRDVRIWEHEDGMVIQARSHEDSESPYETFLLTDEDLSALLHKAYERRNIAPRAGRFLRRRDWHPLGRPACYSPIVIGNAATSEMGNRTCRTTAQPSLDDA